MACGGDGQRSNQRRWSIPFRRIGEFDGPTPVSVVSQTLQPVVVVADLSYATGRPGWRGAVLSVSSPAVTLRRSAFLIAADAGPVTVNFFAADDQDVLVGVGASAALKALLANTATVTPWATSAGDPSRASTITALIGDVATASVNAAVVEAPVYGAATGDCPFPWFLGLSVELTPGNALIAWGAVDNTAVLFQSFATEYADWEAA